MSFLLMAMVAAPAAVNIAPAAAISSLSSTVNVKLLLGATVAVGVGVGDPLGGGVGLLGVEVMKLAVKAVLPFTVKV